MNPSDSWWPLAEGFRSDLFVAGASIGEWRDRYAFADVELEEGAWLAECDRSLLASAERGVDLVTPHGELLARKSGGGEQIEASEGSFFLNYPWDLLEVNEQVVGALLEDKIEGNVNAAAQIVGKVEIGVGTKILPGVFIEGNAVIGRDCKIGPNCYIRGNTAIGDGVHIGQSVEVKNSIIGNGTAVGHLSYVGDSILGRDVNFGAGTIIANFRHDGRTHRSLVDGSLVDTKREKFGAIVGDGVHTGIHTAIYPGRKLGPGVSTRPNETVQSDLC